MFYSGSFMHNISTKNKLAGTLQFQIKQTAEKQLLAWCLEILHELYLQIGTLNEFMLSQ